MFIGNFSLVDVRDKAWTKLNEYGDRKYKERMDKGDYRGYREAVTDNKVRDWTIGAGLGASVYGGKLYHQARRVNKRRIAAGLKPHTIKDYKKVLTSPENIKHALGKYVVPGAVIGGLAGTAHNLYKWNNHNNKNKRK